MATKKSNISNADKEQNAFDMYMNTDLSQKEICAIIGWSEKTFSQKKTKGNWEELKGANSITAHKIIVNLYKKIYEKSTEEKLDADAIIKLANSIEKLSDRKVTISNTMNVSKEIISFIMQRNPDDAKKLITYFKEFIDEKINGN